jgi:DNA-binding GntR family transcriptional regulator
MISGTDRQGQRITDAYEAIRTLIVSGQLGPGSRLVERDLADHLKLSRSPIRSALLRLQQEGYALSRGGERARLVVAPLTKDDAQALYRLLGFLDGEAARRAAQFDGAKRKTIATAMRATASEIDAVAAETPFDPRRFFDLDHAFHNHYLDVAGHPRMMALYRAIRPQADRYRLFYSSGDHVGSLGQVSSEHRAIIKAIAGGDADAAEDAARHNWQRAAERVSAIMSVAGERGSL